MSSAALPVIPVEPTSAWLMLIVICVVVGVPTIVHEPFRKLSGDATPLIETLPQVEKALGTAPENVSVARFPVME
jgi:hypothetical protein